jgi:hypothetical protein
VNGPEVSSFSARLSRELSGLSWDERNELLVRIGRMELRMRAAGQERSVWKGPVPQDRILGADVVVPTEHGDRRGRVICFGVVNTGPEYEQSVIVHVAASGTRHEAPGSETRLVGPDDVTRMRNETDMAARLIEAAHAAEGGATGSAEALRRNRKRGVRDPELVRRMIEAARGHVKVRSLDEGSSNVKITGGDASRRIYVFLSQLRVDLSGFSLDHPGVRPISEQEARDMHLGKVRAQLLFDDRAVAFAAFEAALEQLK